MEKLDLLTVSYSSDEKKEFSIKVSPGTTLREVIFAMAATCKCFIKDGLIPNEDEVISLFKTYLTDPQYGEPMEENNAQ